MEIQPQFAPLVLLYPSKWQSTCLAEFVGPTSSSWWFQPLWKIGKILVKLDQFPQVVVENKKYLKPPRSHGHHGFLKETYIYIYIYIDKLIHTNWGYPPTKKLAPYCWKNDLSSLHINLAKSSQSPMVRQFKWNIPRQPNRVKAMMIETQSTAFQMPRYSLQRETRSGCGILALTKNWVLRCSFYFCFYINTYMQPRTYYYMWSIEHYCEYFCLKWYITTCCVHLCFRTGCAWMCMKANKNWRTK